MKGNRRELARLFVEAQGQMTGHDLTIQTPKPIPELPKLNADSVKCRLTACPPDCPIADLCIDNQDTHF